MAKVYEEFEVPSKLPINREALENLCVRRFFFSPSYSIYGGVKGLYDFGPPGCAIKANIIDAWRKHFILEENMLEIDTATVTPRVVFHHSGHLAKFTDLMVKDVVTNIPHRADHLLEDFMEKLMEKEKDPIKYQEFKLIKGQADNYSPEELGNIIKQFNIKAPDTGNDLSDPFPFNLMFHTQIGPTGNNDGYLRPETAQGIFVNFARLLEYNGGKIPFAAATIGLAYRNEIAPRNALLRVREFTLAEIEHFVHPEKKNHFKYDLVKDIKLTLFPQQQQTSTAKCIKISVEEAVNDKIIDNQTLAYYMARTYLFLLHIGVHDDKLRFRQHLCTEKAHYAQDCWDAEILTSYGWVECVGHADRACYDLTSHQNGSHKDLSCFELFEDGPREVDVIEMKLKKNIIGKTFGKLQKPLVEHLEHLSESEIMALKEALDASGAIAIDLEGTSYKVVPEMLEFNISKKKKTGSRITPSVIEPSYGIGRILYSVLEHSFQVRGNDEKRTMVALLPSIAPVKCSVIPLVVNNRDFRPYVTRISNALTVLGLSNKVDDVGQSIGKRYARTDEIGIPFGITVDYDTLKDDTVTVRERDSMSQIRVPINNVAPLISSIVNGVSTWAVARTEYPEFISVSDE